MPGFANFPLSLIYLILWPLGLVDAYNALVLTSYLPPLTLWCLKRGLKRRS